MARGGAAGGQTGWVGGWLRPGGAQARPGSPKHGAALHAVLSPLQPRRQANKTSCPRLEKREGREAGRGRAVWPRSPSMRSMRSLCSMPSVPSAPVREHAIFLSEQVARQQLEELLCNPTFILQPVPGAAAQKTV